MRVGIISIIHESNTFLVTPTDYSMFSRMMLRGDEMRDYFMRSNDEVKGFLDVLDENSIDAIPIYYASTTPSGRITKDCCDKLMDDIMEGLKAAGDLDGLLLAPHGANSGEGIYHDFDGIWLQAVRDYACDIPIMVTIDPHANLSQEMIGACTAMVAYRTNPHLDQYPVGREAADLLVRTLNGEINPVQAAVYPPIAINIERQNTDEEPCLSLYALANKIRAEEGVLSNSVVLGFPYTDTAEMGSAFIVVTDNDPELAAAKANELEEYLISNRSDFKAIFNEVDDVIASVAAKTGPVCLLDMGDNVGGGSAADSTILARALHKEKIKSYVCIYDQSSVEQAVEAGIGSVINLSIGAKTDELHGTPLDLEVTVRSIHDGHFKEAEVRHGGRSEYDMGQMVIVDCDTGLTIALSSRRVVPFSYGMMTSCGLEASDFQVVVA
ncbi:MAG: M81 family metallopeptidase, partial [Lentisphaeria bacterium]|nr:M81 family metallopeptidase [Lentisphaeria bacterium]